MSTGWVACFSVFFFTLPQSCLCDIRFCPSGLLFFSFFLFPMMSSDARRCHPRSTHNLSTDSGILFLLLSESSRCFFSVFVATLVAIHAHPGFEHTQLFFLCYARTLAIARN